MTILRWLNPGMLARLQTLGQAGKTGGLSVTSASARRELFFDNGRIVGIRTSVDQERLGELLIRSGRITRQHFEDASIFVRHGWRLGKVLTELDILDPAEVDPMVRRQAVEVACAILEAPGQDVHFDEGCTLFETLAAPLSVEEVVIEAARRVDDTREVLDRIRSDHRRFYTREGWNATECVSLTPEDLFLISRFQDGATLEDILAASALDENDVARTLLGLTESGLLVAAEADASEGVTSRPGHESFHHEIETMFQRLEREDSWSALDLARNVDIEIAQTAFRKAVQRYHPDRHHSVTNPELQKKLGDICSKFADALTSSTTELRLRSAESREIVVPLASIVVPRHVEASLSTNEVARLSSSSPQQESSFESHVAHSRDLDVCVKNAKRALSEGDYWRATQLLREAARVHDDDATIHFLFGQALSKNPHWQHEAEQSFTKAIALDPWRSEFYDVLVRLYEDAGLHLRAVRLVDQAREMGFLGDPEIDAIGADVNAIGRSGTHR